LLFHDHITSLKLNFIDQQVPILCDVIVILRSYFSLELLLDRITM
jgi:hypothetical protein